MVKKATFADSQEICDLAGHLGYPDPIEKTEIRLKNILNTPGHEIFVAQIEGSKVAGFIHFHLHTSLVNDPVVEVSSLVVIEEFQHKGIGKALLDAAEDWARAAGCETIRLHSNIIRNEAHKFYLAQGYSIYKTQHAFVKNLG